MVYLIDGHNLIPKVGLSLAHAQDETALLERLNEYARLTGRKIEVFFDHGANGMAHREKFGTIKVQFVNSRTDADSALIARVAKAKNRNQLTVVSSDHHVQVQVKALGAAAVTSEKFAGAMMNAFRNPPKRKKQNGPVKTEPRLSDDEVFFWYEILNSERPAKYSE